MGSSSNKMAEPLDGILIDTVWCATTLLISEEYTNFRSSSRKMVVASRSGRYNRHFC